MIAEVQDQHWEYYRDPNQIGWLSLNRQKASVNTLNSEVLAQLLAHLKKLENDQTLKGLVIQSSKKNGFIAGADIDQFKDLNFSEDALKLIEEAQSVFEFLSQRSLPTIALIEGFCLGGGLEFALACRYRIAIENPKTLLGLPEVHLGIYPGWGGSVRLPRLIGPLKALNLILSGRLLNASEAYRLGLVDALVPKRQVQLAVMHFVNQKQLPRSPTFLEKLPNQVFLRPLLGRYLKHRLSEKVNKLHYPAPFLALEQWVQYGVDTPGLFKIEAQNVSNLIVSETAKNLGRVFYLKDRLKRLGLCHETIDPQLHIVGAGVMGGDIAAWCALKGKRVTLHDQDESMIARSLKRAFELFSKHLKEPHLIQAAADRLIPDPKGLGLEKADLIIEAIVEKLEAKQSLIKHWALAAKADALFATNTSTIPLAAFSEDPAVQKRLIGLHFFNPVSKMPLVEVVSDQNTDPLALQKGLVWVRAIDKLPLPVKSAPGFLVNRILMPYLLEAVLLVESGMPPEAVDQLALDYGMPMGPIELADTVGLDVCIYATQSLISSLKDSTLFIPKTLSQLLEAGHLGKKTNRGFYTYKNGRPLKQKLSHYRPPEDASDRLMLSLFNQAVACLRERIVADADLLDAGLIFGAGFAPFKGGPLHDIAELGEDVLLQRLKNLAERYGDRFLPDPGWQTI